MGGVVGGVVAGWVVGGVVGGCVVGGDVGGVAGGCVVGGRVVAGWVVRVVDVTRRQLKLTDCAGAGPPATSRAAPNAMAVTAE